MSPRLWAAAVGGVLAAVDLLALYLHLIRPSAMAWDAVVMACVLYVLTE